MSTCGSAKPLTSECPCKQTSQNIQSAVANTARGLAAHAAVAGRTVAAVAGADLAECVPVREYKTPRAGFRKGALAQWRLLVSLAAVDRVAAQIGHGLW